ncbi:MAG: hypothetical protein F4X84_08280 [Synechococcus sp. SB0662_bin_45]|uniref:C-type lysozyme inhibitor domain-containing protein n=1 Tax=Synechococcus sp. SB0676_bin_10 TaxID=2604869 RepID=A0A6B1F602_9SYNE|nr:hypothetical protein [Cyanobacteria bacterium MAG IRC3_bin_20]MCY3653457.1 hypothetical protein [Cyanobacteria bacterium MAG IRC1_bin_28]MDE0647056.1 hypothetical protein [Cyanobacteria bacterium MAG IRC4_bin_6]MXW11536.1 hypothetical protein [Synechococcus sp. SB0668_bin_13]MXX09445.1 hypothetical protein [Synechococcus sp. SB0667_bin_8]MXY62247.1 hypothetical protein [Synechococcus sp. SB0665_bin_28]MYE22316.1 hypothetical protein [Synechococcus sp. SB0662_bin_45]MYG37587.1 hypothetical
MLKSLQLALVVLLAGSSCQPLRAAPWWENYGEKENYLCSNQVVLQLRRNEHQASIENFAQPNNTLFRDRTVTAAERYAGTRVTLELRDDKLNLDYGWSTLQCKRLWKI